MDRFDAMRLFTRVVDRGSFTQAAHDLGIPRSTATQVIKQLEARLGIGLLQRTTRVVRPTLDGLAYYNHCMRLLSDIDEVESAFRGAAPRGPLRVDLQGTLARFFVMPRLGEFMTRYPDIELRVSEGDRIVDLIHEGVDCVLRAGELRDSSLIGARVALNEQVTVVSRDYVVRYGMPESLGELTRHQMVAYPSSASGQPYPLEFCDGERLHVVSLPFSITVTGAELYTASALAGLGLIQVPRYRIEQQLEEGTLQIVLPNLPPPPMPVSVLYPPNRQLSPRLRAFVDWIKVVFAELPRGPRCNGMVSA